MQRFAGRVRINTRLIDGRRGGNLWAERYTSVSLRVLDRSRSLLARRFSKMTPSSAGDAQVRFERVVERLTALHERILAGGVPLDPR